MINSPKKISKEELYYFIANFFYNLSRVLPHAVLSVILLSKGMSISQISIIQSCFMIASLISELPSGIISDMISEKFMYVLSLILLAASYFITMITTNFYFLCLSWIVYGTSSSAMTGSLDMAFIKARKKKNKNIKQFNVINSYTILFSGLIGGGIGSVIYNLIGTKLYLVSLVILITTSFFVVLKIPQSKVAYEDRIKLRTLMAESKKIFKLRKPRNNIILQSLEQILLQCFFQYWQILFLQNHFSSKIFGLIYIVFQLVSLFSNSLFSKIKVQSFYLKIGLIILSSGLFIISLLSTNQILFLLAILLFQLPFNIYGSQLYLEFQNRISHRTLSSAVSILEFSSTLVGTITLWIVSGIISFLSLKLVLVYLTIAFLLFSIIVLYVDRKY